MRGNCRMSRERKRQEFFHLGSHTRMNEGPTSRQLASAGKFFFRENYSIKITSFFCVKSFPGKVLSLLSSKMLLL